MSDFHPDHSNIRTRRPARVSCHPLFDLALATSLLVALPGLASADDGGDKPKLTTPQVAPCSERYELVADPAPPPNPRDGKEAVRMGYGTNDDWGTRENVEVLSPQQAGLNETALRVHYPKGTSAPSDNGEGGAGFYATIDGLAEAESACLQYKVRFERGFDFVKGGKLPGLYGGVGPSGGEEVTGDSGFSVRFMWREEGQGELYEYVIKDADYGKSVGRGRWTFPTGEWVTIENEIILNDPDQKNGIARVWIDGHPVLEQQDIVYRTHDRIYVDGLMFSTFFGGHGEEWRTPRDQIADFADFRFFRP
ncbi:hypothetical protein SAMN02745148_00045 [Modicisalibacter ilicicola DSM 19980]|uniref:Polysaccharide lyase 14 domain-containing protein n=1 Tax=Modicisalibacter ilicicola DSM 19980 TaxID=1121942 RepID=A0A1M4SB67_9GAMM|nr:hypothetical protein [Halomonas ilicicola]SHE29287.1 hypothetical protein SAMN02745148_00045 [Halomonas ilicicola DSM 19980]